MNKILIAIIYISSLVMATESISGIGFYNYTYDLTENASNDDGFTLQRVYFTYKNNVSDDLSVKFQTDVGEVGEDPRLTAFLKKAQVDWKSPIGKLTLGMQGMNMFNITEKTWGFRFIEKSPMDKHSFSSSADMGIGYSGKLNNISYSILMTNGSGYKKQENDRFKKLSFHGVYGQPKLVKEDGYNIGLAYSMEPYEDASEQSFDKNVISFFGGYAGSGLRVGAELDMHSDSNSNVTKQIIAFYGSYKVMNSIEGLLYVDMYDPNTDMDKDGETYIISGMNYYATKGLIITPNLRMTLFEDSGIESSTVFKINFQFKF